MIIMQYLHSGFFGCGCDQKIGNFYASMMTSQNELSLYLPGSQYRRFGQGNLGKRGEHDGKAPVVGNMPSRPQYFEPFDVGVSDLAAVEQGRHLRSEGGCPV